MKRFLYCAAAIIMVVVVLCIFMPGKADSGQRSGKTKDYNEVYELLHLSLPRDTVRLSEQGEQDNFHGDGCRLLVFQLSPAGQESLMQQSFFASWSRLPMEKTLQDKLSVRFQADDVTVEGALEGAQGYYIVLSHNYSYVLNTQNKQAAEASFPTHDDLWRNIVWAVLDTQNHQLMIYTWDS